ncbi:MAG: T9SS type A sorting domain-containing protein [Bacteroidetes bacterium]|nr:T9SS type A sorting domain-containing protein [Bacteroidota bacterium]
MRNILSLLLILSGISLFAQQQVAPKPVVCKPVWFDVSPPLRDMAAQSVTADQSWKDGVVKNQFNRPHNKKVPVMQKFTDPVLQDQFGKTVTDTTIENFEGLGSGAYIPPDTYGEVGPEHYFQVVNASYAVYNKTGQKLLGPLPNSTVWNGLPNNTNSGDAVVVYDETANRWLFSQFSLTNFPYGPFYQMIAVSQTPDPTGSWYRYEYSFEDMPDYPKFGVWQDGYYMSCNNFSAGSLGWNGVGAAAFDRAKMLAGDPNATMIYFSLPNSNEAASMLPSDCDGTLAPAGTPNYFTYICDWSGPQHLGILEFHANFTTPSSSTFGNLLSLPVTSFNSDLGPGITQKGTTIPLEALSDRLMYRLQFRKFNDHWAMVCNHTVNAGSGTAGVRWYELRKTTGAWSIYQQATYAPSDNNSRWMASLAMDTAGTIALGYSVAGTDLYPSIRYTGRLKADPLNQMAIAEKGIINGGGCQTHNSQRWGDYSAMTVDPIAPTTFWYTTEYYSLSSSSSWQTRVGSFTFGNAFSSYAASFPGTLCGGESSQLNSMAYGGTGNYSYSWTSIPAGFTSTLKNPTVTPTDTTMYVVTVSDGVQTHHDTTRVSVVPAPVAFAGNDTTVCEYVKSIQLHGQVANYKSFQWGTSGDGAFDNRFSLNPVYHFGIHDYQVDSVDLYLVLFGNSPCPMRTVGTRSVAIDPCTGIANAAADNLNVSVHPNPARGSATIGISGLAGKTALLTLTNVKGEILFSEEISASFQPVSKQVDLSGYSSGIYFIRVKTDEKVLMKKLVVY